MNRWQYLKRGKPDYCEECGCRLETVVTGIKFSRVTGEPLKVVEEHKCPNGVWSMKHDCYSWTYEVRG
jgi:hypothetical protein